MFFKIGRNARTHHFKRQLLPIHTAVQPNDVKSIPAFDRIPVNNPDRKSSQCLFEFRHSLARANLSKIAADFAGWASRMLSRQICEGSRVGLQLCDDQRSLATRGRTRLRITRRSDEQDVRGFENCWRAESPEVLGVVDSSSVSRRPSSSPIGWATILSRFASWSSNSRMASA